MIQAGIWGPRKHRACTLTLARARKAFWKKCHPGRDELAQRCRWWSPGLNLRSIIWPVSCFWHVSYSESVSSKVEYEKKISCFSVRVGMSLFLSSSLRCGLNVYSDFHRRFWCTPRHDNYCRVGLPIVILICMSLITEHSSISSLTVVS